MGRLRGTIHLPLRICKFEGIASTPMTSLKKKDPQSFLRETKKALWIDDSLANADGEQDDLDVLPRLSSCSLDDKDNMDNLCCGLDVR
jgi:hypothetical protein